jgi:hypothetical protein
MSTLDGASEPSGSEPSTTALVRPAASTYPVSRLSPSFALVDVAREIEQADKLLGAVVGGQLEVIAEQIRSLQDRARELLDRAREASELHRVACNFKKRPGAIYHLYRRMNGERYFSMLSPDEWRGAPPHDFEGSFRLELDSGWTRVDVRRTG